MKSTQKRASPLADSYLNEAVDMSNPRELQKYKETCKLIDRLKPQMALALPKTMDADRMARIALTQFRAVPRLLDCDPQSLMKCIMVAAQLGLEPGMLGHVYLIPYKREAQLIIGYKGMIELVGRSGRIKSIAARAVYENEECAISLGTKPSITHTPMMKRGDKGPCIGYYAVAELKDGGEQFEFMNIDDIDDIKKQSKSADNGPWKTHYDEMAKKTVIRRLFKYLPVSVEMQRAVSLDEQVEVGKQGETIDHEFFEVDQETGEILNADELEPKKDQAELLADKLK